MREIFTLSSVPDSGLPPYQVVEASLAKGSKGVKYALTARRWKLWLRLVEEMREKSLVPCSWGFFWALTGTGQYELLKYDNCCCGICRRLGFENYDELRSIIAELDAELRRLSKNKFGYPFKAQKLKRIEKEEEFRRGPFLTHLENQSNCGSHCLRLLLTTHNDNRYNSVCTHDPPAFGAGKKQQTFAEVIRYMKNREPIPEDWHHTCEVCGAPKNDKGEDRLLMCTHCETVAHRTCVTRWHNDLPDRNSEWTCPMCVRDIDSMLHSNSCAECNEAAAICDDVQLVVEKLARQESLVRESSLPSESSSSTSSRSFSSKHVSRSAKIVLPSEMLAIRLAKFKDIQDQYHAHLVQDRNQSCFKDLVLTYMSIFAFYLLVDYWAKIGISKPGGKACCEGDSVGLSAHGSMFVYRNPNTNQRREISENHEVDWSGFPIPPDKGGLSYLEEHVSAYCDDSKQDQFHTKSVMEATIKAFVTARPWLGKECAGYGQSDNATNYRDPTIEIDCGSLGTRCYSVAGMGKDEGDGNNAVIKGQLKGTAVQCSGDLLATSSKLSIPAQTYATLGVQRKNDNQVTKNNGSRNIPQNL